MKGTCASVNIGGADNKVTFDKVDKDISLVGFNNTITYKDGSKRSKHQVVGRVEFARSLGDFARSHRRDSAAPRRRLRRQRIWKAPKFPGRDVTGESEDVGEVARLPR